MHVTDVDPRETGRCLVCGHEPRSERRRADVLETGLCARCDRTNVRVERKRTRETEETDG